MMDCLIYFFRSMEFISSVLFRNRNPYVWPDEFHLQLNTESKIIKKELKIILCTLTTYTVHTFLIRFRLVHFLNIKNTHTHRIAWYGSWFCSEFGLRFHSQYRLITLVMNSIRSQLISAALLNDGMM